MLDAILFVNLTSCSWRRRTSLPADQPAAPMKRDGPHGRTSQRRPRTNKQYRQSLPPFLAVHRHRAMALHSCASILAAHCSLVQAAAQLVGLAACECAIEHAPENGSDTGIRTRKKPQVNASKMCTSSSIGDLACTHGAGEAIRHELQQTNERERETVSASSTYRSRGGVKRIPRTGHDDAISLVSLVLILNERPVTQCRVRMCTICIQLYIQR
jgi:hypothetical protein